MTEPMATTSTTAPGAAGRRVGHEGTYEGHATTATVPHGVTTEHTTTTAVAKGHHDATPARHTTGRMILLVILCFILPPLAVGLEDGFGFSIFLNIILLLLGWIPAIIHSLFVVCT